MDVPVAEWLDSSAVGIAQLVAYVAASPFSAVKSSDVLFPNDFGENLFLYIVGLYLKPKVNSIICFDAQHWSECTSRAWHTGGVSTKWCGLHKVGANNRTPSWTVASISPFWTSTTLTACHHFWTVAIHVHVVILQRLAVVAACLQCFNSVSVANRHLWYVRYKQQRNRTLHCFISPCISLVTAFFSVVRGYRHVEIA